MADQGPGRGWDNPRLRLMRTAAVVVLLCLLAYLVVTDPEPRDLGSIGAVTGALLVLLGFEWGIRYPQDRG